VHHVRKRTRCFALTALLLVACSRTIRARVVISPPTTQHTFTESGRDAKGVLYYSSELKIVAPQPVFSPQPSVPQAVLRSLPLRDTGVISLYDTGPMDLLISAEGRVLEVRSLVKPAVLSTYAEAAVRSWRFRPAMENGKAIAIHYLVDVGVYPYEARFRGA